MSRRKSGATPDRPARETSMISSALNGTVFSAKPSLIPALKGLRKIVRRSVRNYGSLDPVLGRIGSLEVRLATTAQEIRQAQKLRFTVFYEEMSAVPQGAAVLSRRDIDEYDSVCDHLLVLDHDTKAGPLRRSKPKVVGIYRLLRQDVAERHRGFYTRGEYDIAPLLKAHSS